VSEWQPIGTAPKDGTRILVFDHDTHIARWRKDTHTKRFHWLLDDEDDVTSTPAAPEVHPTHWQPLPPPPQ